MNWNSVNNASLVFSNLLFSFACSIVSYLGRKEAPIFIFCIHFFKNVSIGRKIRWNVKSPLRLQSPVKIFGTVRNLFHFEIFDEGPSYFFSCPKFSTSAIIRYSSIRPHWLFYLINNFAVLMNFRTLRSFVIFHVFQSFFESCTLSKHNRILNNCSSIRFSYHFGTFTCNFSFFNKTVV